MSYLPSDEDGIEVSALATGSQFNIPTTAGGLSGALKTVSITNNENYTMIAEVHFQCRLRTEMVNGGRRTEIEGNFFPELTTGGTLLGVDLSYAEVHVSGTNSVVSSTWGFPAGEGMQINGLVIPVFEVAPGGTETVRVRWQSSAVPQNVETTVANSGFVQFMSGLVKLHQKRGQAFDVTIT